MKKSFELYVNSTYLVGELRSVNRVTRVWLSIFQIPTAILPTYVNLYREEYDRDPSDHASSHVCCRLPLG